MSRISSLCRLHKLAVAKMNGSSHHPLQPPVLFRPFTHKLHASPPFTHSTSGSILVLLYDDELPGEQLLADVHRLHTMAPPPSLLEVDSAVLKFKSVP